MRMHHLYEIRSKAEYIAAVADELDESNVPEELIDAVYRALDELSNDLDAYRCVDD